MGPRSGVLLIALAAAAAIIGGLILLLGGEDEEPAVQETIEIPFDTGGKLYAEPVFANMYDGCMAQVIAQVARQLGVENLSPQNVAIAETFCGCATDTAMERLTVQQVEALDRDESAEPAASIIVEIAKMCSSQ